MIQTANNGKVKIFEPDFFHIEFGVRVQSPGDEPEDFIYRYYGKIYVSLDMEDDRDMNDDRVFAGSISICHCDIENAYYNQNYNIEDVLDSYGDTEGFKELYEDEEFNENVLHLIKQPIISKNLLIVDRLKIFPAFRGQGLGLPVLYRALNSFGFDCEILGLIPFPLQFLRGKNDPRTNTN